MRRINKYNGKTYVGWNFVHSIFGFVILAACVVLAAGVDVL